MLARLSLVAERGAVSRTTAMGQARRSCPIQRLSAPLPKAPRKRTYQTQGGSSRSALSRNVQISVCSDMARASSTSIPRYLTVLSIFVCVTRRRPVRRQLESRRRRIGFAYDLFDPANAEKLWVGISAAGVFVTRVAGGPGTVATGYQTRSPAPHMPIRRDPAMAKSDIASTT